ncbi:MAG: SCO family protein [Bacteroidetes bacterium]|nr:SCO family protein [Bacteroidota bacterium]MDA0889376.1 SCO family protein [Bacteroidota bacterium]MDA1085297.1 SCO family protein [Bacteroidota bacterium]
MSTFFRRFRKLAFVLLVLSIIIVGLFYTALKPKEVLPVFQPAMVTPELVDESIQFVKKYHTIAPFSMTNQNGETITEKEYDNTIYVADFFFTTCPSICPIMTKNMHTLQEKLIDLPEVKLLSFSVTPQIDSVAQLKRYALKNKVDETRWNLVTGKKKEIYELARKSYLVVKDDGDGGPYDMIHTENFVLVDKQKRIRGFYDGTQLEAMDDILRDIELLVSEK